MTNLEDIPHISDITIAGGGPAGTTIGRILASWGYDVIIIAAKDTQKAGEVLGPEADPILDLVGLTQLFEQRPGLATQCYGVVTYWSASGADWTDHRLRGVHGWSVDRLCLGAALKQLAIESGCRWLDGTAAGCTRRNQGGYEIEVITPIATQIVNTKFVVDATGRPGSISRRLGARRLVDDRLIAAATCFGRQSPQPDPYIRLTTNPDGWWYRSDGPTGDTRLAVVADPRDSSGKPLALVNRLRLILGNVAKAEESAKTTSPIFVLDASSARLDCCARDGWIAVGDAATAFDPLCGQGLAQAFGSAFAAAHAVRERMAGHAEALVAYDHVVQATYHYSREQLQLRYAYWAECERTSFWRNRIRPHASFGRTTPH
jgi:flavin-dependent dehydrogenase